MVSSRTDLSGARVGVWGLGREGRSVVRVAVASGAAEVIVVDSAADTAADDLAVQVRVFGGEEHVGRFADCDVLFLSPGVPWVHPALAALRAAGVPISSATDLFLAESAARTIGVTGTKGKSTTASFLSHTLQSVGRASVVAGNIGLPLLEVPDDPGQIVVAEMSSQQCAALRHSPRIAVVTNLGEDHLTWHGGIDPYIRAKAEIFARGTETLICEGVALAQLRELSAPSIQFPGTVVTEDALGDRWPGVEAIDPLSPMIYPHNRANGQLAVLAIEAVLGRQLTTGELVEAINTFTALPHRLQLVARTGNTRWIDDSLATTAESVVVALAAMPADTSVAVIVGGLDRGISYAELDDFLLTDARTVHLVQIPSNGPRIGERFAAVNPSRVHIAEDLTAAVRHASELDVDVVLLSPGAPSYDFYRNFEEKSAAFRRAVGEVAAAGGAR